MGNGFLTEVSVGNGKSFSASGAGTAGYPYGKIMNLDPYLMPDAQINLRRFLGLDVKA